MRDTVYTYVTIPSDYLSYEWILDGRRIPKSREKDWKKGQSINVILSLHIENLEKFASEKEGWTIADDNREGIRVFLDKDHGDGWFLLRLSVHDPLMPFNAESDSVGGVKKIVEEAYDFFKICKGLDIGVIESFLK